MADIIAQPILPYMPTLSGGMELNPWLDQPAPLVGVLGIPWWFIISCVVVFAIILVNVYWALRMKKLAAVRGYRDTLKKANQEDSQVWVLGKTMKLTIEMLRYVDSVFSYYTPTRIQKWRLSTSMSVMHVGNLPAMLVSDDYDQTRDIVSEIALCHAADNFNAYFEPVTKVLKAIEMGDEENLAILMDRSRIEKIKKALSEMGGCEIGTLRPIDSFHDYENCGRKILKILNPDGIPIPPYAIYSPTRFRKYFPRGRSAGFLGGQLIREARALQIQVKEQGFWEKTVPLMIFATLGIFMICAAWFAPV